MSGCYPNKAAAARRRWTCPEYRARISAAQKGRRRGSPSPETLARQRAVALARLMAEHDWITPDNVADVRALRRKTKLRVSELRPYFVSDGGQRA